MRGVTNVVSGSSLLFEFMDPPSSVSGDEDIFGLEVNPFWDFEIPPFGSEVLTFELNLASLSGVDVPGDGFREGRLRIYPNPSVGAVDVRLHLHTPSAVSADIFDLSGRLVRRLDVAAAGTSVTLSWDGRNLAGIPVAGGIYFIRVSYEGSVAYGKLAIVR
jgi:hypothetical protein